MSALRAFALRTIAPWALLLAVLAGSAARAEAPGGSNYGWYKVEACDSSSFYILRDLDKAEAEIEQQLRAMYANGQRRLRIPIFFYEGAQHGSLSIGPDGLAAADLDKVDRLLELIRTIGFREVIVAFFPAAQNDPAKPGAGEAVYRQNWSVIRQVRRVVRASGLPYVIDLGNEQIPHPSQVQLLGYVKRLWRDYTDAFGDADTLGFSIIPDPARIAMIPQVYGDRLPRVVDLHIYQPAREVKPAKEALRAVGLGDVPWIVGESHYKDAEDLRAIRDLAAETGTTLLYTLQWPNDRRRACEHVSTVPIDALPALVDPPPN